MKIDELEGLLDRLALRLRTRTAAARTLLPAAALLGANLLAVLTLKISGAEPGPLTAPACTALAVAACASVFGLFWAFGPISPARAAAELDSLAGLKERTASLVDARARSAGSPGLRAALQADVERSLVALDADGLAGRARPLPPAARWIGLLLVAGLAALLVPGRGRRRTASLAEMLLHGEGLVRVLNAAAEGGEGAPAARRAETARRALALLKAPPPAGREEAERRRGEIEALAAELRRRGADDLADQLAAAALALAQNGGTAAAGNGDSAGDGEGPAVRGADRYPESYSELLARYFAGGSWTGGANTNMIDGN
ncbi:MAG: hypothetical protein ACYTGB_01115 [Planctomycetota bacterium]